jgi:hypothetical protein
MHNRPFDLGLQRLMWSTEYRSARLHPTHRCIEEMLPALTLDRCEMELRSPETVRSCRSEQTERQREDVGVVVASVEQTGCRNSPKRNSRIIIRVKVLDGKRPRHPRTIRFAATFWTLCRSERSVSFHMTPTVVGTIDLRSRECKQSM